MADIELRGSLSRIRKCAYELLSIKDLMDDEDSWDLMGRDLRLKSTFLFCDFKKLISHSSEDKKFSFTEIANRLFYYIQELDHAMKILNVPLMRHRYNDTALVLQEVLAAIMPGEI
ncbi:hypothetical protein AQUCO_00201433v1 [Aquilegia coerulea]|uniref:Uncharacterized protein n=1 Tax=Aquilegia coerulea TaxID=218851 RepID=A0A2G5F7Z4_AQUCA|nr:hypothetical protein AQUCO_00201433v1 [Aquilegia coerulea]